MNFFIRSAAVDIDATSPEISVRNAIVELSAAAVAGGPALVQNAPSMDPAARRARTRSNDAPRGAEVRWNQWDPRSVFRFRPFPMESMTHA